MSKSIHDIQSRLRQVDVVFVIDTTGSMGGSIQEVQRRLRDFANKLVHSKVSPNVAFGVVAYRDHPPEDKTYVTRIYPLTEDLEQAQKNVNTLKAEGGGDGPEAVLDGLNDALDGIKWRDLAHKVIILVGDAPPHGVNAGGRWPKKCPCGLTIDQVTKKASKRGVIIHAVGVNDWDAMQRSFKQIAKRTGGEFVLLAKVDTLIDRILSLLHKEIEKVAEDIDVFGVWARSADKTAAALAAALGKGTAEVDESLKRLAAKGALALDEEAKSWLERMARNAGSGPSASSSSDSNLLDSIKIGFSASEGPSDSNELNIRILDD